MYTTEDFFGFIALITSCIGLVPQVYKTIKTQSTQDLSLIMLLNYIICSGAWIVYGACTHSNCVLYSNVVGLLSSSVLACQKLYYEKWSR